MKVSGPNLISNFVGRVDYGSSKATCGGRAAGTVAGFLVQEEGDGAILVQGTAAAAKTLRSIPIRFPPQISRDVCQ